MNANREYQLIIDPAATTPVSRLLKLILSSELLNTFVPDYPTLRASALHESDITVLFAPSEEMLAGGRGQFSRSTRLVFDDHQQASAWVVNTREIVLRDDLNLLEAIKVLLFELCNAALPTDQLDNIHPQNFLNRDEYALAKERMEYQSYLLHMQTMHNSQAKITDIIAKFTIIIGIISALIYQHPLPPTPVIKPTALTFLTFEELWQHVNIPRASSGISHAECYRKEFDSYQEKREEWLKAVARKVREVTPPEVLETLRRGFESFMKAVSQFAEESKMNQSSGGDKEPDKGTDHLHSF